jgi:hypothetical protein
MSILNPRSSGASRSISAIRPLLDGGALARFSGPVALVEPNGTVICANAAAAPIQAMLGTGSQRLAAAVADAIATGEDCTLTLIAPADSGDHLQFRLSVLPLGKGEAALVIGHSIPVAAPAIGVSASVQHRYKDLLALTGDFAWETSAAGIFTFVSEDGGFGWPPEAMLGRRAAEFLAESRAGVDPFLARVPVSGIGLVFRRADGGSTRTSVAAMPILGHDSRWLGACGVAREESGGTTSRSSGELVRLDSQPGAPKQAAG